MSKVEIIGRQKLPEKWCVSAIEISHTCNMRCRSCPSLLDLVFCVRLWPSLTMRTAAYTSCQHLCYFDACVSVNTFVDVVFDSKLTR